MNTGCVLVRIEPLDAVDSEMPKKRKTENNATPKIPETVKTMKDFGVKLLLFLEISIIKKGSIAIVAVKYRSNARKSGEISVIRYFDTGYSEPQASMARIRGK